MVNPISCRTVELRVIYGNKVFEPILGIPSSTLVFVVPVGKMTIADFYSKNDRLQFLGFSH